MGPAVCYGRATLRWLLPVCLCGNGGNFSGVSAPSVVDDPCVEAKGSKSVYEGESVHRLVSKALEHFSRLMHA